MKIIISPAKKMNIDTDIFEAGSPKFINEAERIKNHLQTLSEAQLKKIWKCSDDIAKTNVDRLKNMNLEQNQTPAILAYEGLAFKYMAASVFTENELDYVQNHLYILSGFYGALKPFDGVVPYRLEMQTKISVEKTKDLYDFWGEKLAQYISSDTDIIINLASKEYSKAIAAHLSKNVKLITCAFKQKVNDKLVEKGTMCKMARGEMVRFMAENECENVEDITKFNRLNYAFSEENSTADTLIFIKA